MVDVREFVNGFVMAIVAIAVGVSLVPVIEQIISQANLSGSSALMVSLIPFLVTVGILMFTVKSLF